MKPAERAKHDRARRYAARVEIDGRLVAVNAREHGKVATASNHGCQCQPCTDAARAYNTPYRRRRRQTDPDFRERANAASRRWLAERHGEETA